MKTILRAGLTSLFLLCTLSFAQAQGVNLPDIFTGEGDNQTNSLMNLIFGGLFPGPDANNRTLISLVISSLNILIFALALLYLFYLIIAGVMDSAHEGIVLGQKSSMWVPIRLTIAIALLIPLENGYNGAQHGISYVSRVGTSVATLIWGQTVDLIVADRVPIVGSDFVAQDAKFLQQLWRAELCRAAYNFEVSKGGNLNLVNDGVWSDLEAAPANDLIDSYTPRALTYSTRSITGACGTVTLPPATAAFKRLNPDQSFQEIGQQFERMINTLRGQMRGPSESLVQKIGSGELLSDGDLPDLAAMLTLMRQTHSNIVNGVVNPARLSQLVQDQSREDITRTIGSIGADSGGGLSANTAISGDLTNGGWIMAGSYYFLISQISQDSNAIAEMFPAITPGTLISTTLNGGTQNAIRNELASRYFFDIYAGRDARKILANIGATYNAAVSAWNEKAANEGLRTFITERVYAGDDLSSPENFLPPPDNLLKGVRFLAPEQINTDPLIGLMAYGTSLVKWMAGALVALSVASATPVVGGGFETFTVGVSGLFNFGIFAGAFLSFILAYVPAIIFLFAVLSYFILIIQAIFAAPLWMIAMMSTEGTGITSPAARRGWGLLFAVLAVPVLMIFGFLVGIILFRVGAFLLNPIFFAAISSQMAADPGGFTSIYSLIVIVVATFFVALLYLIMAFFCFSLVGSLPNAVINVITDFNHDFGSQSALTSVTAGGAIAQGAGQVGASTAIGGARTGRAIGRFLENRRGRGSGNKLNNDES